MTNRPFFSVVIPTYNRADLIMKTLTSVFNQSYKDFEIIVVDNCSTDTTLSLLTPLKESGKINLILHDKNYERAVSRNTGMTAAKGKFVTLLDSDDLMYHDNLKDAHAFVLSNPDIHVFQNLYELIDLHGTPIYHYNFPSLKNSVKAIAEGNFMSCIGDFISERVYRKYQFDTSEEVKGIEDWDFWLRIASRYSIGRINKINSGIVHHTGRSITKFVTEGYIKKNEYVVSKIEADPELNTSYRPYLSSFTASCYMLAASMANSAGLFEKSRAYLMAAFKIKSTIMFSSRFNRILLKSVFKTKSKIDE